LLPRGGLSRWVVGQWRRPTGWGRLVLAPPSWLFGALTGLRRTLYRLGWLARRHPGVPVVVVGNITVGGSGKTPLVVHLVDYLQAHGYRPGVVARGYGGQSGATRRVDADADPAAVGDEAVLLASRCGCPVAIGADRAAAAGELAPACDVIVADDGLQHYGLARDIEIAVVDGDSGLGNSRLLPAGPLREPVSRLARVDWVAVRDGERAGACRFGVQLGAPRRLGASAGEGEGELGNWSGRAVHAVAGIGVPERFFSQLEDAGLIVERHPFADHHRFRASDMIFDDDDPVLMTEKDAVKCRHFDDARLWYVPAEVADFDGLAERLVTRLQED